MQCSVGLVDMTSGSQPEEEGFNSPTEYVSFFTKDVLEWIALESKMYVELIARKFKW